MAREISYDENAGTVTIDGFEIDGFIIDEDITCPHCGYPQVYFDDFDAEFCPQCNIWLHEKCGDPGCRYCRKRPEAPLPPPNRSRRR